MTGKKRLNFGGIAIAKGFITEETLDEAIKKQKRFQSQGRYPRIGIILLKMGKITSAQLMSVMLELERQ